MFNGITKKAPTAIFNISGIGEFSLLTQPNSKFWFCNFKCYSSSYSIELSIETIDSCEPSEQQINAIKAIPEKHDAIVLFLLNHLKEEYKKEELTIEKLSEMYYLMAITLKPDGKEWWYVLEPDTNTPSKLNHMIRFTVIEDQITWCNINA
ncbi:hypothetical protein [Mucilaginibacter sp.]|uniref:hypothetical protein n=1 Tax=Mucilaginibacter sp. TaxID=1882438 RepID=UPI003D0C7AC0